MPLNRPVPETCPMYAFNYHRPSSLADAAKLLGGAEDGKFVAGGQTLLPTLKQRLASPSDLIDVTGIPELKGITVSGGSVPIGAAPRHAVVAASAAETGRASCRERVCPGV